MPETNSKRHSLLPFRQNSNSNNVKSKRQSLYIDTKQLDTGTHSRVRSRLSSIFSSTSPVVLSLKDTFNLSTPNLSDYNKRMSLFKESPTLEEEDDQSSSESSDNMSASPTTTEHSAGDWQIVGVPYSTYHTPPEKKNSISLAYHVNQILGSTMDQVDEEINRDWEESRSRLRQSLQLNKKMFI